MTAAALENRNRKVGLIALGGALAMLGLGYASAPLYDLFCRVTGFGGTTQRASDAEAASVGTSTSEMVVRFDANVAREMPWKFRPEQVTSTVRLGGRQMAVYLARNDSVEPVTGTATFNVAPERAAKYFNKIQCFCFEQQTLQPGQEVRMPVVYFIDPAILKDPEAKDIGEVTLSYTFHKFAGEPAKGLDRAGTGG